MVKIPQKPPWAMKRWMQRTGIGFWVVMGIFWTSYLLFVPHYPWYVPALELAVVALSIWVMTQVKIAD
jgi:hypothetical protein